jgi:predicted nucleic acid-binding protein
VINKGKGIVVNTSPWISLSVCGQICLLERLYHDVYIPMDVRDESLKEMLSLMFCA